jgi:hypothetical protein
MQPRSTLAILITLAGQGVAAFAADGDGGADGRTPHVGSPAARVELGGGLARRRDSLVVPGAQVNATGTGANLAGAGAWFAGGGHLGVCAQGAIERFTLRGQLGGPFAADAVDATAALVSAGLAARTEVSFARSGPLTVEAHLGYGVVQIPIARLRPAATGITLAAETVRAHGPSLSARLGWSAHRWGGIELGGDLMPLMTTADVAGTLVEPRRWEGRVVAIAGPLGLGGAGISALLSYRHGRTSASGAGVALAQDHDLFGLELRTTWPARPRGTAVSPSDRANDPEPAPQPQPARAGRLSVIVRERGTAGNDTGVTLPGIPIEVSAAGSSRTITTDARGRAVIEGLPAGPIALRLGGAGWLATREIVAFPAQGEAQAEVLVTRDRATPGLPASAVIAGLVRSEHGTPIAARVRIDELGIDRATDANGGFHLDLPPGSYTLTIEAEGFVSQRKVITAGRGEQKIYDLELQTERP